MNQYRVCVECVDCAENDCLKWTRWKVDGCQIVRIMICFIFNWLSDDLCVAEVVLIIFRAWLVIAQLQYIEVNYPINSNITSDLCGFSLSRSLSEADIHRHRRAHCIAKSSIISYSITFTSLFTRAILKRFWVAQQLNALESALVSFFVDFKIVWQQMKVSIKSVQEHVKSE